MRTSTLDLIAGLQAVIAETGVLQLPQSVGIIHSEAEEAVLPLFRVPRRPSVYDLFAHIDRRLTNMAQSIDDLNAAIANLTTAVNSAASAISTEAAAIAAANANANQDPAIEAAVGNINNLTTQLNSAVAAVQPAPTAPTT